MQDPDPSPIAPGTASVAATSLPVASPIPIIPDTPAVAPTLEALIPTPNPAPVSAPLPPAPAPQSVVSPPDPALEPAAPGANAVAPIPSLIADTPPPTAVTLTPATPVAPPAPATPTAIPQPTNQAVATAPASPATPTPAPITATSQAPQTQPATPPETPPYPPTQSTPPPEVASTPAAPKPVTPKPATAKPAAPTPPTPKPELDERSKEEILAATNARASGIPYFDTRDLNHTAGPLQGVDIDTLRQYRVAPLHRYNEYSIELGITDQTDRSLLPALQEHLRGIQLTFKTISHTGYNIILNHIYYNMFQRERDGNFEVFGEKLSTLAPKRAFQYIAQLAFWLDASDIHIEPQSELARIRFRIDGVLHPITIVSLDSYKIFLSDLQTRAEIKWGSDTPQSGRISYNLMSHHATVIGVNMRIETIPTFHGEEIVVRIFNNEVHNLNLNNLGFSPTQVERLTSVISHPNGMVLTVGPTGSGKTSTLYSLINSLNSPEVKIITLEDPVEYDLPGISQISVHTEDKESFAERLRAVMREDPNVVMIGEIRDIDTAKTALQAALTGHLVLSTFHATNAGAAISRMLDMIGINPLFASAIRLIIAQRLARRICTHCTEEIAPTKEQLTFIKEAVATIPEPRRPHLAKNLKLHHGKGCPVCHGLGYHGRVAIIEMMSITPDIEQLMTRTDRATTRDIQAAAVRNGMVTLLEDGLHKVFEGITTIDEIMSLTVVL